VADVSITWRPLTQWPSGRPLTPHWQREDANFVRGEWKQNVAGDVNSGAKYSKVRTPLTQTLKDLDRELDMIGARDVVVQLDISEQQLRLDGGLRSDAAAKSPPIVLTFTRKKTPYVFACDHFKRWQDNLRAIALGLDGLRRLERYHIAQTGDQYRGWLALPAAGATVPTLSTGQAATLIARLAGAPDTDARSKEILTNPANAEFCLRLAKAKTHPDAGGRNEDWTLLQEAERILRAHHGMAA
jgi:hypothetical protein